MLLGNAKAVRKVFLNALLERAKICKTQSINQDIKLRHNVLVCNKDKVLIFLTKDSTS